jgi:hypothetical protein
VAEVDGLLAGSLIAAWDWRANLHRLAIAPRYSRRGLGQARAGGRPMTTRMWRASRFAVCGGRRRAGVGLRG